MEYTNEKKRLTIVALLLFWCITLLGYRLFVTVDAESDYGAKTATGLFWNLFLAALPLMWSAGLESAAAKNQYALSTMFFGLWLLFLPNAPYILTDLIHLKPSPDVPLWYLLAMLLSCAGTGMIFGYLSLNRVHRIVEKKFGRATGWAFALGSLLICGFGIYVGRFLRWNSWDAITSPMALVQDVSGQFTFAGPSPHPLTVTIIFGVGLALGYLAVCTLFESALPE